ncbi:hypothetical protein [Agrobacterium sp. Azo12]|uniref:hypothetical protein n=1 Tax=Agrobacterium sp. Azo12 TaxID=3031129 RepID=UPI0023D7E7D9|nr:hypothetical protein [Agrobacterium sp. Azo12]MDO5896547.1 hypothetical protein [Agrobacterium sp. Azo12]
MIRQADLARETGLSEMTISRRLRALDSVGKPLAEIDILSVLVSHEAETAGLHGHEAAKILSEFSSELRWLTAGSSRKVWLVLGSSKDANFTAAAMTQAHLDSLVSAFPRAQVLPLHALLQRARQRYASMTKHLNRREAA